MVLLDGTSAKGAMDGVAVVEAGGREDGDGDDDLAEGAVDGVGDGEEAIRRWNQPK